MLSILSSLWTSEINKKKSSAFHPLFMSVRVLSHLIKTNCAYSMWSWRCVVWSSSMCLSHWRTKFDEINHCLWTFNNLFWQPTHNDLLIFVFLNLEFFMVVEQIIHFPWVNFVISNCENKVSSCLFLHNFLSLEKISTNLILNSFHCVSFTWSCLTICKACDYASFKYKVYLWLDWAFIKTLCSFCFSKTMIKFKPGILNILCDSIHSEFTFMNDNGRICARNAINLPILKLMWEKWPFSYKDVLLGFCSWVTQFMRLHFYNFCFLLIDFHLELNITFNAVSLVDRLLVFSQLFDFFHLSSSFLSVFRKFLNCISGWFLLGCSRSDRNVMKLFESISLLLISAIHRELFVF